MTNIDILDEDFKIPTNVVELAELIDMSFESAPTDKRTIHYKQWRDKTNEMVKEYNKKVKFTAFVNMS
jgi:hypothetical protein